MELSILPDPLKYVKEPSPIAAAPQITPAKKYLMKGFLRPRREGCRNTTGITAKAVTIGLVSNAPNCGMKFANALATPSTIVDIAIPEINRSIIGFRVIILKVTKNLRHYRHRILHDLPMQIQNYLCHQGIRVLRQH